MFKAILTLFRGTANQAAEEFTDRHALSILNQQVKDCAHAIASSRKAVAIAIAQNEQEVAQHKRILVKLKDLEARTIAAMEQGKSELAREGAETIALMEAERDACAQAQRQFNTEINCLKAVVRASEARLRDLQRGQRIANATDKAQRLRKSGPSSSLSTLKDAENTLLRLRTRQQQIDATAAVMTEMDNEANPSGIIEKLAENGCGAPFQSAAEDVLARLSRKARKSA